MSWANIDDQSTFHAKVVQAGNAAWGALCRMIAWSSAHGTDGAITTEIVNIIANDEERIRLVQTGLLEVVERGFVIHDFLEWNRSAKKVKSDRKMRAKAGKIGGLISSIKRQASAQAPAQADAQASAQALASDTVEAKPNPIQANPSQSKIENVAPEAATPNPKNSERRIKRASPKTALPPDFAVSEAVYAMCLDEGLPDPYVVFPDFVSKCQANGYRYVDWEAAFRSWMRSRLTRENYPPMEKPLRVIRLPDRDRYIPKPGEEPDMTGLFDGAANE